MPDQKNGNVKKPDNVVQGPWPKSKIKIKTPDKDIIKIQHNIQFAEALTQSLMVQMIHTMSENGIDVSDKNFICDMAMAIAMVNGSIYRNMKLEHEAHKLMEHYVYIEEVDGMYEIEIDFESINEIIDFMKEDDDGPEIS